MLRASTDVQIDEVKRAVVAAGEAQKAAAAAAAVAMGHVFDVPPAASAAQSAGTAPASAVGLQSVTQVAASEHKVAAVIESVRSPLHSLSCSHICSVLL
jgi:hypothetical protein